MRQLDKAILLVEIVIHRDLLIEKIVIYRNCIWQFFLPKMPYLTNFIEKSQYMCYNKNENDVENFNK